MMLYVRQINGVLFDIFPNCILLLFELLWTKSFFLCSENLCSVSSMVDDGVEKSAV